MAKNEFKPFATGQNANVMTQEEWEALPALLSGFTAGKASSAQVNKALRQSSFVAAALAQFMSDKNNADVLDNGNLPAFVTAFTEALNKVSQQPDATTSRKGIVQLSSATNSTSEVLAATPAAVKAANDNANSRVPSSRKVNNRALNADITLSSGDVGAIPVAIVGSIGNGGSMAAANKPGWWLVDVPDTSTVSDFPKNPDGTRLYGHGFMFVELDDYRWFQHYYNHRGVNAKRQMWSNNPPASTAWVIEYNTANKPGAGDVGAYTKGESDNKFQPKGNYTPAGEAYTKAESDGRFQPKGNYTPAGQAYTKAESDARYVQNIRVSAPQERKFSDGAGWSQNDNAFVTAIWMVGGSSNNGGLYVRYIQKYIDGKWVNVTA